jgi:hypothetical protein
MVRIMKIYIGILMSLTHKVLFLLLLTSIMPWLANLNEVNAITQFYFAIPDVIEDLKGITFSVEIGDYDAVSWTHSGSSFIPDSSTMAARSNLTNLHLDNNDFLLAIEDDVQPGTRLYMCASIPYPLEQYDCQWDAVDKDKTGRAEFDFFFQSHRDIK